MSHTPGPWQWSEGGLHVVGPGGGNSIGEIDMDKAEDSMLALAAPDLLEACKAVAEDCPQCAGTRETHYASQEKGIVTGECRVCAPALKAIAKAEGKQ